MGAQTNSPRFKFYLSQPTDAVHKDSPLWDSPLPIHRKRKMNVHQPVTYGDYFSAVHSFMEQVGVEMIGRVVSQNKIRRAKISEMRIFLDKHGQFYHPARIEADICGDTVLFVLNVAVSADGKNSLEKEFELLKRLRRKLTDSYIPIVCGRGDVLTPRGRRISMFLGEWFDHFYEFHLSYHPTEKQHRIRVWTPENGKLWLTKSQTKELYRQAALILSYYYDVETFEQILSWHHAAGDFIVNIQNNSMKMKLVTVRKYASMVDPLDRDMKSIFEALLVYLLNLSIRIRLDRLDGVGEIVWSDDIAVEGALKGFFDGLSQKPPFSFLPAPLDECFRYYLLSIKKSGLVEYAEAVVGAYNSASPEASVIQKNLSEHVAVLHQTIQKELAI